MIGFNQNKSYEFNISCSEWNRFELKGLCDRYCVFVSLIVVDQVFIYGVVCVVCVISVVSGIV